MSGWTRSHCEREVFDAAVDLILREDLPKLARLGSRVFKEPDAARCLERIRKLVSRRESATAQQAMKRLAQLEASEEASEMQGEMICTEKRLQRWLAELEKAAPDPAAPEPQKPPEVTRLSFCGAMKRPAEPVEEPEPKRQALGAFFAPPATAHGEPCDRGEDLPPPATAVAPPSNSEPEDFMRNAQDKPIFKNSSHVGVECEFRHTGPGVEESRLEACLFEVEPDKYEGRGCVWMVWRLPGPTRRFPSKCHYASLRPGPAADKWIIYHKTAMTLLPQPPESTRLYKIAKGQCMTLVQLAAMCETQMGTMRIMSWEDYNKFRGAEAPTFSPRQVLRNYDEMTPSEFQSHVIKLDTRFRGDRALNQGKRPPATEEEFVHMQSRSLMQLRKQITEDQVTGKSLLVPCDRQLEIGDFVINDETVSCWWYDAEKHHSRSGTQLPAARTASRSGTQLPPHSIAA